MKELILTLLVAHAGGALNGVRYANSIPALESSYQNGFRHFELDFHWNEKGELVLIHDWDHGYTPTPIDDLAQWHRQRADAVIITDVKKNNLKALKIIGEKLDKARVVPQVFFFEEHAPTRALGYKDIILMLYRADYNDAEVVEFARGKNLFAVAMPWERALNSELASKLRDMGVRSCAQTVEQDLDRFRKKGVGCFYTDFLKP